MGDIVDAERRLQALKQDWLFHVKIRFRPALLQSERLNVKPENPAIAKMTVRCALYMDAMKN